VSRRVLRHALAFRHVLERHRIALSPCMPRKLRLVYPKRQFRSRMLASFIAFAKERPGALIGQ
jgi:hypothetical protein